MSRTGVTGSGLGYRIPALGWRIAFGGLRMIPLVLLLVGLPAAALAFLGAHEIALPLSILAVTGFGVAITAVSTARYIARPTPWYGPLSIASGAVTLLYVLVILASPTYTFSVPGAHLTVTVGYRELLEILLLVPALALLAGIVTSIEDLRFPRERLPFEFPP